MGYDKDFKQLLKQGKQYEMLVAGRLKQDGYIVHDISRDDDKNKGDWRCELPEIGFEMRVEVKSDTVMHKTGNIFMELATIRTKFGIKKESTGWFHSDYDRLYVVDTVKQITYILDFRQLKEEINIDDYRQTTFQNVNGNVGRGLLLPLKDAVSHGWLKGAWKYTDAEYEQAVRWLEIYCKKRPIVA